MDIFDDIIMKCNESLINRWAAGFSNVVTPPWLAYISVTNLCNNRCRVCAHSKVMRPERGVMSIEVFTRIVEQLPDSIKKIYLMKQGEPFLNKNLELFVEYLRSRRPDVYIAFHTNGIVAKKERVSNILALIDSLGISISAITPEIYKGVHGVDTFNSVIDNIKDISELLLDMPENKKPHVFIDYVYQNANSTENEHEVVDYFKSNFPGLSSVDFHWVYNFQGEIEEGNLKIYNELEYCKFPCCVFPWSSITFCYDGKIDYCFVDPRENRFLGDITTQSFDEIWNGGEYRRFRAYMVDKKFDVLAEDGFFCHKCSWLWSMKAQSPRNLNGGYSSQIKSQTRELRLGDLLDMSQDQLFILGTEYYFEGEIHQAMAIFHLLLNTSQTETVLEGSRKMLKKCQQVLKKYENLSLWQEMLEKEGYSAETRECRYYPIF